jgi:hypothetical protein
MKTRFRAVIIASIPMGVVVAWELSLRYGGWIFEAYVGAIFGCILYMVTAPDTKGE